MKNSIISIFLLVLLSSNVWANNISITNANTTTVGTNRYFNFTVSWDNSWRTSTNPNNWDAAWVFVKYKKNAATVWSHATIRYVSPGTSVACGHSEPTGSEILTPSDAKGVFIQRDTTGQGTVSFANASLRWDYAADNIALNDAVTIQVFGVEMVYVPQGSFYVGSGGTGTGEFYAGGTTNLPFQITSENSLNVGNATGNLYYTSGSYTGDAQGPIPATFPKGYNAFYCMKYEVSQEQYADFLNMLTTAQVANRYYIGTANRYTLTGTYPTISANVPNRACNFLSWEDGAAYTDWACLRPMTELEYEKACRGAGSTPVYDEYAWGNNTISITTSFINDGTPSEGAANGNVMCNFASSLGNGPLRVGGYATATSTRQSAGATYYGIMEMSGNLWERTVSVGNGAGRSFIGNHGDGVLSGTGYANQSTWASSTLIGVGIRGGSWYQANLYCRVSDRPTANYISQTSITSRYSEIGMRCVRTAP